LRVRSLQKTVPFFFNPSSRPVVCTGRISCAFLMYLLLFV
jgi:hypothetical protein